MTNLSPRHARRWPKLAMAVIVLLELVMGIGVAALVASDSATPITLDDAVDDFRELQEAADAAAAGGDTPTQEAAADPAAASSAATNTTAPAAAQSAGPTTPQSPGAPGTGLTPPAPGVYTYDTAGWEEISMAGGRHTYPAETTVRILNEGAGQRVRWSALQERWDEWTTVPTEAGEEWTSLTTYRQFFGQADERRFECQPGAVYIPRDQTVGKTFEMHCGDEGLHSVCQGEVIGMETTQVGGAPVETLRLRMVTTMDGDARGTMARDYWVLPSTGLLVRMVLKTDTEGDGPVGTIRYQEEVEMTLKSLAPAQ